MQGVCLGWTVDIERLRCVLQYAAHRALEALTVDSHNEETVDMKT